MSVQGYSPNLKRVFFYKTSFCYCVCGQGWRVNYSIDFHQIWNRSSTGPLQRPIKMHKKNFSNIWKSIPFLVKKNSHKEVLYFYLKCLKRFYTIRVRNRPQGSLRHGLNRITLKKQFRILQKWAVAMMCKLLFYYSLSLSLTHRLSLQNTESVVRQQSQQAENR